MTGRIVLSTFCLFLPSHMYYSVKREQRDRAKIDFEVSILEIVVGRTTKMTLMM